MSETGAYKSRVALYIPKLEGGGADRVMLNPAGRLAGRGYAFDLIVNRCRGIFSDAIPAEVGVVELKRRPRIRWRVRCAPGQPWVCAFTGDSYGIFRPTVRTLKPFGWATFLPALTAYLRHA